MYAVLAADWVQLRELGPTVWVPPGRTIVASHDPGAPAARAPRPS